MPALVLAQQWTWDANTQRAYDLVLDLQTDAAIALIPEPKTAQELYVTSLAKTIELLITEDRELYAQYGDQHEELLGKRSKSSLADDLFLQAEIRLQWTFVYLKFGHEMDAAWSLRQAYLNMEDCRTKFPNFTPIKKTAGLLHVIVGSVPEKYNWVLSLMSMTGEVQQGLQDLESLRASNTTFSLEADLLYTLVQAFILQDTEAAMTEVDKLLKTHPDSRLINYLGASIAIKNSQSDRALSMLTQVEKLEQGDAFAYVYYLKGEALLNKGEYVNAINAYRTFINKNKGQNYTKDAHYKIGLCYLLNGRENDAREIFKQATSVGLEDTEADKAAAKSIAEDELPNVTLSKIRHLTDGGYYPQAQQLLDSIRSPQIPSHRDHVEYYYRKARLTHKTNKLEAAKTNYLETIKQNDTANWYYAPNACLQLGYIYRDAQNKELSRDYFEKAISYKKHEYKNSIDSKAKAALAELKRTL